MGPAHRHRPSRGAGCPRRPAVHPRSPPASPWHALGSPFPQPHDSDTIPVACRPPVCASLSRVRRRQVRHAQAGRFRSPRFPRRANSRGRGPVLREARRIKAYSLVKKGDVALFVLLFKCPIASRGAVASTPGPDPRTNGGRRFQDNLRLFLAGFFCRVPVVRVCRSPRFPTPAPPARAESSWQPPAVRLAFRRPRLRRPTGGYGAGAVVEAQAFGCRLTRTKRGDSAAQVTGLRGVTRSWVNRLAVAPELMECMKYLNAL